MTYTIFANPSFNSLEISFDCKPSGAVRDALKALRFRWNRAKKVWYGFASEAEVKAAIDGSPTAEKITAKGTKQDHIRIYYNGIKIDGGKLIRCYYSLDNNADHAESVSISVKGYSGRLPKDLLPVENDTDIMTDYFDTDGAYITPEHPLYKYFRYAAEKARARDDRWDVEHWAEELNGGRLTRWADSYRERIAAAESRIKAFEAMKDPGQPTAEDLEEVARQRKAEEEAAEATRKAEQEDEDARSRALVYEQETEGHNLISAEAKAHPIEEGAPVVTINWSEHPAFYSYPDNSLLLSVTAADNILRTLDEKQHMNRGTGEDSTWYYKTKFTITGKDDSGEEFSYTGRYDLGDNDGGLLEHIRTLSEYYRTHTAFGQPVTNPPKTTDGLELVKLLSRFVA